MKKILRACWRETGMAKLTKDKEVLHHVLVLVRPRKGMTKSLTGPRLPRELKIELFEAGRARVGQNLRQRSVGDLGGYHVANEVSPHLTGRAAVPSRLVDQGIRTTSPKVVSGPDRVHGHPRQHRGMRNQADTSGCGRTRYGLLCGES